MEKCAATVCQIVVALRVKGSQHAAQDNLKQGPLYQPAQRVILTCINKFFCNCDTFDRKWCCNRQGCYYGTRFSPCPGPKPLGQNVCQAYQGFFSTVPDDDEGLTAVHRFGD